MNGSPVQGGGEWSATEYSMPVKARGVRRFTNLYVKNFPL
jgi:hypothetical protein